MSSASYKSDLRYAKAARLAANCPALTVTKAMRAEGFIEEEVNNTTNQRQVRRMAARVPPEVVAKKTSIDDVSPLTDNSKKRLFTEISETQ